MALSKRMKKIVADFYALCRKYDEACEKGDRKSVIFYDEEVMNYCFKFQKELNVSNDYLSGWKRHIEFEKEELLKEESQMKEMVPTNVREKILLQKFYDSILKDEANGAIKWN